MCKPDCGCDDCWTRFFQVRWPQLVAAMVREAIGLTESVVPAPRKVPDAKRVRAKPHKVPKVRPQRRKRRAPVREVVDVEADPMAEPVGVLAPEPPAPQVRPRPEKAPDEGSRDLRTIIEDEAAESARTQPVVKVTIPRLRIAQLEPRPVVTPKRTVDRDKALREIRLAKLKQRNLGVKPKRPAPEEDEAAPKSLEDEDMEALQFDDDVGSERDAVRLNAAQLD